MQVAWRRYWKRKMALELARHEEYYYSNVAEQEFDNYKISGLMSVDDHDVGEENGDQEGSSANTRRGINQKVLPALDPDANSLKMPKKLFKPEDPDFSADL